MTRSKCSWPGSLRLATATTRIHDQIEVVLPPLAYNAHLKDTSDSMNNGFFVVRDYIFKVSFQTSCIHFRRININFLFFLCVFLLKLSTRCDFLIYTFESFRLNGVVSSQGPSSTALNDSIVTVSPKLKHFGRKVSHVCHSLTNLVIHMLHFLLWNDQRFLLLLLVGACLLLPSQEVKL